MIATAAAKINLYLHVTGKRDDGYHLLDSLVVFADIGDTIEVAPHQDIILTATGPYAGSIDLHHNTLIKAAMLLRSQLGMQQGAALTLTKNLPVGAGIGGGSADAAATFKLLAKYWNVEVSAELLQNIALKIGADVPACVQGSALYMEGIGEVITPIASMPPLHMILVNPQKSLLTKDVFAHYKGEYNAQGSGFRIQDFTLHSLVSLLHHTRNDLHDAAIALLPDIADILQVIEAQEACMLARMSGSGATCFGLFALRNQAEAAAQSIRQAHPNWWCVATTTTG